jgi:hypothetical protein
MVSGSSLVVANMMVTGGSLTLKPVRLIKVYASSPGHLYY